MKKFFLGAILLFGTAFMAKAQGVDIYTSCGTGYTVTCPTCSTADFINIAMALDDADCG